MADEQQDVENSSEENITTSAIEEDELELSLSLRPLNCSPSPYSFNHPKNLLETSSPASNGQILSKRDAQALRRHEAKLKRDYKRKASGSARNGVVVNHQEDFLERRRKVPNLGFQAAAPPLFGWNSGCVDGGFRPYQGQNGKLPSHYEGRDGASLSSGSSSGISDNHQSISGAGGNSSDAGSHSSHSHSQLPPPNVASSGTTYSQLQPCSSQLDLQPTNGSNESHSKPQMCCSYSDKMELISGARQPSKSPEGASSSNSTCQQNEASPPNNDKDPNTTPRSTIPKEAKGETGKPPKPVGLMGKQKLLFSQMPYVSTTGNGPDGKTITGFLYKYTKAEVSIVCVCHGASFSPAGFVEHAGGVDVEYPLKHIRVVPFALG